MSSLEDRVYRIAREVMTELSRDPDEIAAVEEPLAADFCVIRFRDPSIKAIEIPNPIGAGESQEKDEIRRALQYRFHT